MPEEQRLIRESLKEVLEITMAAFPHEPAFVGATITYEDWCKILVERIGKIPGRSPRVAQHKNRKGKYTGKIMVVDDEFTQPPHNCHTDAVMITRYHETRDQWRNKVS